MSASTTHVSIQEAREHLERLLDSAEQGQQVAITRPDRPSIYLKSEEATKEPADQLPSLDEWRAALQAKGEGLSDTVRGQREEERY